MDTLTKAARSSLMSRIRSQWTGPERRLYKAMKGLGMRPLTHNAEMPGKPDFLFRGVGRRRPLAVFVEGCFFHGCPRHYKRPKSNRRFWDKKVRDNTARDRRNGRRLNRMGVRVKRVWEHSVRTEEMATAAATAVLMRLCRS